MSNDLDTAFEAEIVALELIRLAERLRAHSTEPLTEVQTDLRASDKGSRKHRDAGETYVSLARWIYRMRRQRTEFWPAHLFSEPAWDIMLDLYIRLYEGRDVSVTSACIASCVPPSTALRWVNLLESADLIERHNAAHDFRVHYLRLTANGTRRMQQFLRQIDDGRGAVTQPFLLRAR